MINVQKSNAILYASNEPMEFEIKNTVLFILAPTKMKHLCRNVTKYEQELYEWSYKILMKEINE